MFNSTMNKEAHQFAMEIRRVRGKSLVMRTLEPVVDMVAGVTYHTPVALFRGAVASCMAVKTGIENVWYRFLDFLERK